MRLAGDIHNYSRYEQEAGTSGNEEKEVNKEKEGPHAPVLVVSGGGGAFLHGTRMPGESIDVYGENYSRKAAFPKPTRRFALRWIMYFRLVNWEFDVLGVTAYFLLCVGLLPVQITLEKNDSAVLTSTSISVFCKDWLLVTTALLGRVFSVVWYCITLFLSQIDDKSIGRSSGHLQHEDELAAEKELFTWSFFVAVIFIVSCTYCLEEKRISLRKRLAIGFAHGLSHVAAAVAVLAFISVALAYMRKDSYVAATSDRYVMNVTDAYQNTVYPRRRSPVASVITDVWLSPLLSAMDCDVDRLRSSTEWSKREGKNDEAMVPTEVLEATSVGVFCRLGQRTHTLTYFFFNMLDPVEALLYYDARVNPAMPKYEDSNRSSSGDNNKHSHQQQHQQLPKITWLLYYAHMAWFYWLFAAPVCAFILGFYLCLSVSFLNCSWHNTYSALQICDWKHFLRFRIRREDGALQCYVVGVNEVPRRWERDSDHDKEIEAELFPAVTDPTSNTKKKNNQQKRTSLKCMIKTAGHCLRYPSVWRPFTRLIPGSDENIQPRIVDFFVVKPTPVQ